MKDNKVLGEGKVLSGISRLSFVKVRNRKGYAIQNEHKIYGRNKAGSRINAAVYQDTCNEGPQWSIAGVCWKVGTFDPGFNYGPFDTREEALEFLEAL